MNIQSTTPATPLRQRMTEDMRGRNLGRHSQRNHLDSCARFAAFLGRSPEAATADDIRRFQLFLVESGVNIAYRNRIMTGVKFLLRVTLTAERIRDKIAASKKKGLWMGGLAPLGYDPHPDPNRRELVVNAAEAKEVCRLFSLYLECGCLNATARAAETAGLRSKRRVFANGRAQGGTVFSRGQIHRILTNPVYRGLIRHKDKTWPGTHPAIIDEGLWVQVQEKLQSASARRRGTGNLTGFMPGASPSAPLMGRFRDETGDRLTPTHTKRHGRRLRYYVSNRLVTGKRQTSGWRLPAPAFERSVATAIADHLATLAGNHTILREIGADKSFDATRKAQGLAAAVRESGVSIISATIASGEVSVGRLRIRFDRSSLAQLLGLSPNDLDPKLLELDAPFTCRRRGVEMKIVAGDKQPSPDPAMVRALRNAHRWAEMLKTGIALKDIAGRESFSESYVGRIIPLATLSPKIQEAITTGSQPLELSLEILVRTRLPLDWFEQEKRFGFVA